MTAAIAVLLPICATIAATFMPGEETHSTWTDYGGGPGNAHYVALNQINKSNVTRLQPVWSYPIDDNGYQFNPIVIDNVMYVLATNSSLVALEATTGREIWIHEKLNGIATRGINYWESKDRKERRLLFQIHDQLQAIDARTGKSILTFGKDGFVNLREGLGRNLGQIYHIQSGTPGKVFENLIVLGSFPGENYMSPPGDVRALDVLNGKLVWTFHAVPRPGEYGYNTWPKSAWKYAGGVNVWGEMSLDDKRGIVYLPTGSATYDYYGADRKGANLFANCLIALDARTGKRLWHFQTVHHDLWDYDLAAAPQLITVHRDGKTIDAVAQAGKTGFLYVFDRVTGKPLWPIEERTAPRSDVPGEEAWPTQPFPTAPPPFARQKFTAADVNPYMLTPDKRARLKDTIAHARNEGIFTPPSMRGTVCMPGNLGGANWGGTASNPANGMVYVMSIDAPTISKLATVPPDVSRNRRHSGPAGHPGQVVYQRNCQACHGEDLAGFGSMPSLTGIAKRMNASVIRGIVLNGKGQMPAFANLTDSEVSALCAFLTGDGSAQSAHGGQAVASRTTQKTARPRRGPVVASGGAPAGQLAPGAKLPPVSPYGIYAGPPYPKNVAAPTVRYYNNYSTDFASIGPPWSTITAYDLNRATIRWQVPLGDDVRGLAEGAKNTGSRQARVGMVVTSAGLLFAAGNDGKVRAYDTDNGRVLWSGAIPGGSRGIPTMYQVNGRQYLVVCATYDLPVHATSERLMQRIRNLAHLNAPKGYIVFALPDKFR